MKNGNKKSLTPLKKAEILRAASQLLFFIAAPGLFSSAFGAVKTAFTLMGQKEALELSSGSLTLLLLLGFTWVFGRFFCGTVCSFGAFGDLMFFLGETLRRRLGKKTPRLPQKAEKILVSVKYVILAVLAAVCYFGGQSAIHGKSPWDAFAKLISGKPEIKGYETGFVIFLLLAIGMLNIPRFFCRFLCPLGAIFSLLPPALVSLKKPSEGIAPLRPCGSCQVCTNSCPAGLKLNKKGEPMDTVYSGECFRCMRCANVCPQKKPALFMAKRRLPLLPASAAILLSLFVILKLLGLTRI